MTVQRKDSIEIRLMLGSGQSGSAIIKTLTQNQFARAALGGGRSLHHAPGSLASSSSLRFWSRSASRASSVRVRLLLLVPN